MNKEAIWKPGKNLPGAGGGGGVGSFAGPLSRPSSQMGSFGLWQHVAVVPSCFFEGAFPFLLYIHRRNPLNESDNLQRWKLDEICDNWDGSLEELKYCRGQQCTARIKREERPEMMCFLNMIEMCLKYNVVFKNCTYSNCLFEELMRGGSSLNIK